jgi:hypothetical protein
MSTGPIVGVTLAAFIGCAAGPAAVSLAQSPDNHRSKQPKAERCWKDGEEIENPDGRGRPPIVLAEHLWKEPVRIPAIRIKLCVEPSGKVSRVIQLRSSGNDKVDEYYRTEWSKRTFKAVIRNGQAVRSVATVATQWNPR